MTWSEFSEELKCMRNHQNGRYYEVMKKKNFNYMKVKRGKDTKPEELR